jgi:hypothetical protein
MRGALQLPMSFGTRKSRRYWVFFEARADLAWVARSISGGGCCSPAIAHQTLTYAACSDLRHLRMKEEKMKRAVDVKSKLERAFEREKKILATYETLREIINSAENPDRNSPEWISLEMAADMAFDAYLKARREVQRWSDRNTSL